MGHDNYVLHTHLETQLSCCHEDAAKQRNLSLHGLLIWRLQKKFEQPCVAIKAHVRQTIVIYYATVLKDVINDVLEQSASILLTILVNRSDSLSYVEVPILRRFCSKLINVTCEA